MHHVLFNFHVSPRLFAVDTHQTLTSVVEQTQTGAVGAVVPVHLGLLQPALIGGDIQGDRAEHEQPENDVTHRHLQAGS